ncbi:MAG: hypothetical protein CMH64_01035 [Nanoarchaeota archaeon]|nr:hypothetical protein [Nanoarchaeota archaeon]
MIEKEKVDKIFIDINRKLSSKYKGKMVAIEPASGDYFVGSSTSDAYKKASQKYPKKKFFFKRIGFKYAYFVGNL